ncbi:DNA repair protein RecN [Leptotrichia wadei]|jgi:DNA repair protein RecN|uniref:DNA repair protein RecN n=1 Tax=Leptotrichia wadei TaxID=157687 RepID=A0A134A397_9FUSO|nr:DNA repair protein RecN [Leptotrichia wadei]KXB62191.1 DNA repair protein RecN [Leptotrichia wadei]BBM47035.1 DNA repair protein RecN [Leptotrichia wadei]
MLRELRLNNLAIIKKLDLEFNDKFIALTGETGAGKSIILNGISLLIGERSHTDMIRNGAQSLFAEGVFELNENQKKRLNELGFEIEDDELIITRYFDRNAKSKITVNGSRMTLSRLKELMVNIIDLVGQHEHQFLLNSEYHLHLLDRFLDDEGKILSRRIRENVNKIKKLNLQIGNIEEEKTRIAEKKDILEFQLNEINSLELKENEDNELEEEYKILFNAGKINEKLEETSQFLKEGEFSILTALGRAKRNLEQLSDLSESYNELYEKIESVLYEVEEISYSVDNFAGDVEIDDKKLEKIVERIDNINKLKLKYGSTIAEILEYRDKIEKDLSLVNFENEELENLKTEKNKHVGQYFQDSEKLSEIRMKIAENLQNTVDVQLDDLNMENAKFKVEIRKTQEITMHGIDNAEFMIATNVGETFKPLAKIASGGEISRIMLALKTVFSAVDNISVLIFDEIDTGISGETVRRVAEKLRELSRNTQIICVTHSPQIAGRAQQQFFIKKEIENNFTETKVHELNTEERIREIARIISGDNITEASINHAKEIMGLWDKKVLV